MPLAQPFAKTLTATVVSGVDKSVPFGALNGWANRLVIIPPAAATFELFVRDEAGHTADMNTGFSGTEVVWLERVPIVPNGSLLIGSPNQSGTWTIKIWFEPTERA